MKNLVNFRQAVKESWNSTGYFFPAKDILQLKHMQKICLILLSATCGKIQQIPYVIFETISHLSRKNSSVLFSLKHYILSTSNITYFTYFISSKWRFLVLKLTKVLMVFFKQKVSFSSKSGSLFSILRDNSSIPF